MHVDIGIGELLAIMTAIVGAAWGLLNISLRMFEKRLDDRFGVIGQKITVLDGLVLDIKRLEVEQVRRDGVFIQQYVHKEEFKEYMERQQKTVERIFTLLQSMNDKLDTKVSREECERMREIYRKGQ